MQPEAAAEPEAEARAEVEDTEIVPEEIHVHIAHEFTSTCAYTLTSDYSDSYYSDYSYC